MFEDKVRPIATGARWPARQATAVAEPTVTREEREHRPRRKADSPVDRNRRAGENEPCASSGVRDQWPRTQPIRNNSAAATPPAIWMEDCKPATRRT